jgi:Fur family transcriptional regulator, ferric uptake regulator
MKKDVLTETLVSHGYRQSSRRNGIVETFLNVKGHISAEELLARVREKDPRVGLTTVYRTLKLLTRSGLAVERKFNRHISVFEPVPQGKHHDHLICLGCGTIMEFENQAIETLQESVAREMNFRITRHILELYGYCGKCVLDGPGEGLE